jgi:ketosteroid isomerase-like protein
VSTAGHEAVERWLTAYGEAWETRDPAAAAGLFTEDATYAWGPFEEPLRGSEAIRERWADVTSGQSDVAFGYEVLGVVGAGGVARWWCSFVVGEIRVELEGIFLIVLAEDGRCREFREWWNERTTPA